MTASKAALAQKSTAEIKTLITKSDAKLIAAQEKNKKVRDEAAQLFKEREKYDEWASGLTRFADYLLEGIANAGKKTKLEISIATYTDETERGYSQVIKAISQKFNVTIKIEFDDGGSDAGGWSCPMPSSKAIVTFNKGPAKPEPEDPVLNAVLEKIAKA